jgi:hypothetical protein
MQNKQISSMYTMWTCDEVCRALSFLLDNIYVRFGNTLFKQIIGIPMGTNCAPLVADFSYCYERDFMWSLSENTQEVISAFNNTSRYLDDIFNLDNSYFDQMVSKIYPTELQLLPCWTFFRDSVFIYSII